MEKNFGLTDLICVTMLDQRTARPLFQSLAEGEGTPMTGSFCALGEEWPFNMDLHPAVRELYAGKEDRVYFEEVTSTANGTEYLFGYVPIVIDGEVACHLGACLTMNELRHAIALHTRVIEWINGALLLLSAGCLLLLIYRRILRPLSSVQRNVREYRTHKDSAAVVRSLDQIDSANEVGRLADDISAMAVDMEAYSANMARLSAEKERIGTELALATRIQTHLLPNIFPAFPERREFDLYATMNPAKEVGGDFYDFFLVGEDHLALVVADVSGKGVPAALFSMIAKTMLKTSTQAMLSPARVLEEVNLSLGENNEEGMFVTTWLGVLEISTGELTYADAGHEKLARYHDGEWRFLPKACGVPLAQWPADVLELLGDTYPYRNQTIRLRPGDVIFQYTDGVTEAADPYNQLFGEQRLLEALDGASSVQPEALLPQIREKLDAFAQNAPQFDDITMLALRYNGQGSQG